ncbi:MAG: hypothetical protein IKA46_01760 [Clostridia bacterium]|nr:hypothetical protein [Clostridia bacterium]
MKKIHLSDKIQRTVAEILTDFMFAQNMEEVHEKVQSLYKDYQLCEDPFTHCPCSPKEYEKNILEYERQTSIARYGYYDGPED